MKNNFILIALLLTISVSISKSGFSQSKKVLDFNRTSCDGKQYHLNQDLEDGKAVFLFFYMPNCGSCPPVAKEIQTMMMNMPSKYQGKVIGYAMPFNNSTSCTSVKNWTSTNKLTMFTPLDSGAKQVANYGGFGMPTVVLLGGKNHRVMYSSLSYSSSDTSIFKDSINTLMKTSSIENKSTIIRTFSIFPNPVSEFLNVRFELNENTNIRFEILEANGKIITQFSNENGKQGINQKQFNISELSSGSYILRAIASNGVFNKNFTVVR